MSEQNKGEGTVDPSGKQTDSKNNGTKSPEELTKIADDQRKRAEKAEAEAKQAKQEAEDARKKLEEATQASNSGEASNADIVKIAEEFDVDPKFAEALATAITSKNSADIKKAEADLKAEIAKRDEAEKHKAFNEAFDKAYAKATEDLDGQTVNQEAVKTVYLQKAKDNPEITVAEVIADMYGTKGRATSEDDVRGGADGGGTEIDFETANRDPKKLSAIMADPQAKAKYYAWRDKNNM